MALPGLGRLRDARLRAAAGVPVSQVLLAIAGYVLLALAGRTLPAVGFASISAFYLMLNTVGRGVFASVELETSRAIAAADAAGAPVAPVLLGVVRRTCVLVVLAVGLSFAAAPLLPDLEIAAVLALGSCAMALSYGVRGPLAARRRYVAYSATFLVEAGVTVGGALFLAVTGTGSVQTWVAVLVLSPAVAAAIVASRAVHSGVPDVVRRLRSESRSGARRVPVNARHRIAMSALLWTALFYLSSQGVWNLVPVTVTSALAATPAAAAGFVAVAVILRAPVFVFPAIQAVLLPLVSAKAARGDRGGAGQTLRPVLLVLGVAAVPWLVGAVLVVPWLSRIAFAVEKTPSWGAVSALAASTIVGAAAFVLQTRVLAFRRHRDVGLAWFAGLLVLGLVSLLPGDPQVVGGLAQLAAAIVVLVGVVVADRRIGGAKSTMDG